MVTVSDVLVVGAGPVGLTTACQLARLGVQVRVVEALERPTTESRAVGVHARSLEMLASLGVLPRLEARGRRIAALEMLSGETGRTRARMELAGAPTRHPYVLDVAQPDTEAVLAERAAELGVVVERGVELTGLTQDADGVEVTLRSPRRATQTARVGWLVGADGGHSTTRHLARHASGGRLPRSALRHGRRRRRDPVLPGHHPDVPPIPTAWGSCSRWRAKRARIMFFVDPPGADAGDPTLEQIQALADARMGGQRQGAQPALADLLRDPPRPGRPVPPRAGPARGRRRAHPQPGRGAGDEHRHPGRGEPGLEARARRAGSGGARNCSTPTRTSGTRSGPRWSARPRC